MKRAVFYGSEVIKVEETPTPKPRKGWATVKIAYCAVCGSEVNLFFKPRMTQSLPHKMFGQMGPFALGHECSGVVSEIGEGVTRVKPGDRVAVQPIISCGECEYCRRGLGNLCADDYALIGAACDGGMAEYVCVPEQNLYIIPDDMKLEDAALVQCGAVSFGSVMVSGIRMGDTALVIGVGSIGLMTVQACKESGARVIIASDIDDNKLDYARELGATRVVNPTRENLREIVSQLTGGRGVDYVYECAGAATTVDDALACVRKLGTIMFESVFYDKLPLPGIPFLTKMPNITTAVSPFVNNYDYMVELAYRRKMTSDRLVTQHVTLEGISDAIRKMRTEPNQMKIMINIDPSLGE